ncbi:MAG: DNA polymerase IV [Rhodospirillales bacterium]|nr:DNA polymerase IV [Rhodospirillales bacterium]
MAPGLCRDCLSPLDRAGEAERCPRCGSTRLLFHPELFALAFAHVDCDAFYASVEKRDDPTLADRPLIVGGGRRGVATTACYIARRYGVRSAMPMFKALKLCPQAVVIRPDIAKYARVSRDVRALFDEATPLVEPVSLDEAYLDLAGTEAVHRRPPALTLAGLARRIETEIGITVSIGLSFNKFLAKLASEIDKPRGFGVIGRQEARGFLAGRPVRVIPGVGAKQEARLTADGIAMIGDLQRVGADELGRRYGAFGRRLAHLAEGEDSREVERDHEAKILSAETTFETDLAALPALEEELWPLCEKLAGRLKQAGLVGRTAVLKLKTADFRLLTRRHQLDRPTQLAEAMFRAARPLLAREAGRRRFRLIGIGLDDLMPAVEAGPPADLFGGPDDRLEAVERAIDRVREKFGPASIGKGRGLKPVRPRGQAKKSR